MPRLTRFAWPAAVAFVLALMLTGCTFVVPETPPSAAPPLTQAAMTACPRSQPNLTASPDPYYIPLANGYGSADGTLFTQLWPGSKVILTPNGGGSIAADGTLTMKWPWYRTVPGPITISGRRLDAPAPPMPTIILAGPADGYGETGFHPSALIFPSAGCWEVIGRVGTTTLTFVALVVQSPLDLPWPGQLPEGLRVDDADLTGLPHALGLLFRDPAGTGELHTAVIQGAWLDHAPYPQAAREPVTLAGRPALCVQGAWDAQQQWRGDANAGLIEWRVGAYSYRITHTGLGLACADLIDMAATL